MFKRYSCVQGMNYCCRGHTRQYLETTIKQQTWRQSHCTFKRSVSDALKLLIKICGPTVLFSLFGSHFAQLKLIQDSLGFRIPIIRGIRIPWAVFRIPNPRFSDFTAKNCWIPEFTAKMSRVPETGFRCVGPVIWAQFGQTSMKLILPLGHVIPWLNWFCPNSDGWVPVLCSPKGP